MIHSISAMGVYEVREWPVSMVARNPTNKVVFAQCNMCGNSLGLTYSKLHTLAHVSFR